ncbi:MAG: hypothetical protein IKW22_07570 [Bacteroidaceae bacterium]|nr:hypothetical protein [Bacteroidaceae bacterium]
MKKTYMAPAVEVIKVDAVNMMAISVLGFGTTEVDTSMGGVQLGRELTNGVKDLDLLWD